MRGDGWIYTPQLVVDGRDVPWDNFERFEVENGSLYIYLKRSWFFRSISVPLARIPDYLSLLEILPLRGASFVPSGLSYGPTGRRRSP